MDTQSMQETSVNTHQGDPCNNLFSGILLQCTELHLSSLNLNNQHHDQVLIESNKHLPYRIEAG